MRILIVFFVSLALVTCKVDMEDEFYFEKIAASNIQIPSDMQANNTYHISFDYRLMDGCHSFDEIEYTIVNNNTRKIIPFAKVQNNVSCTQAIIDETYTFDFTPTQAGNYILKFWKGNNNGIDEFETHEININ